MPGELVWFCHQIGIDSAERNYPNYLNLFGFANTFLIQNVCQHGKRRDHELELAVVSVRRPWIDKGIIMCSLVLGHLDTSGTYSIG